MALTERLLVLIDAKSHGAVSEFRKVGAAASTTGSQTQKTSGILSKFGLEGLSAGAKVAVGAGVAGVAVAALGKVAYGFAQDFATATSEVRAFQRVTGDTAENASKLVYALNRTGITAQQASKGFFRFTALVQTGKVDLAQYGAELVRNEDGTLNLAATTLDLADALSEMDATARTAAIRELFGGRQGEAMLAFFAKSKAEIRALYKLADENHQVFSQEDLDNGKKFTLAMKDLQAAFKGIGLEVGRAVTPAVTGFTTGLTTIIHKADETAQSVGGLSGLIKRSFAANPFTGIVQSIGDFSSKGESSLEKVEAALERVQAAQKRYAAAVAAGGAQSPAAVAAGDQLAAAYRGLSTAQADAGEETDQTATKIQNQEAKTKQLEAAIKSLSGALLGQGDAQRGVQGAQLDYADAQQATIDKTKELNEAKAAGRQDDESEAEFLQRIAGLERDVTRSLLEEAAAKEETAKASLAALTANQLLDGSLANDQARKALIQQLDDAIALYGDSTGELAKLRLQVLGYSGDVRNIPKSAHTVVTADVRQARAELQSLIDKFGTLDAVIRSVAGGMNLAIAAGRKYGPPNPGLPYAGVSPSHKAAWNRAHPEAPILHGGGTYRAPGGAREGPAWLETGERVLSRNDTARAPVQLVVNVDARGATMTPAQFKRIAETAVEQAQQELVAAAISD